MLNKEKVKEKSFEIEWYHLLPLVFILAIVPLIVYSKVVPLSGAGFDFWTGAKEYPDFFSYYKVMWLSIATLASALIYLFKLYKSSFTLIKKDIYLYYGALGIYLLFVIASTLFSKYQDIAKWGFTDRYEGVYVLVAYILIFFMTINLVNEEKHVKVMIGALLFGATVIGVIGIFQYFGYDLWQSKFGRTLILPASYESMADNLQFQFSKHTIYGSLYHSDYVGSYMAMLFPFSFSLFVLSRKKSLKVLIGLSMLLIGFNWLGSNSRAGMVGGALALLIFVIAVNKFIINHWKYFVTALMVAILMFFALNSFSNGYLGKRVNSLFLDVNSLLRSSESSNSTDDDTTPLRDVSIIGQTATITTTTEQLSFHYDNGNLKFNNKDNEQLEGRYDKSSGRISLNDPKYSEYSFFAGQIEDNSGSGIAGKNVLTAEKGPIKLIFELKQDGINLINNTGQVVDLKPVESWGFKGKERIGSSRGYIWSRSLPLLKNTLYLGYGPDTFVAYFPQNDIMGKKYAYYGDMWQIVDKPHNLYLQIALNTGVISLLAVLMLFGLYIIKSMRIFIANSYDDFLSIVGVSVFVAIVGYLGAAFFNDSIVSVAPVFWILLGLGVSINHMIVVRESNTNTAESMEKL